MAIHKTESGYAISSNNMWLDGSYACEKAAKLAFRLPDDVLAKFNGPVPATYEQVLAEYRAHRDKSKT